LEHILNLSGIYNPRLECACVKLTPNYGATYAAGQNKQDDCYVAASYQERIAFARELTAEVWSIRNNEDVERRLQINVTNLIRK
jgi:hypothetical protein